MKNIVLQGGRTHNLKNISVSLPRDKLIVITGLSGSGKSSLAFDTLYAEGQRRYVESLSAYARQFLSMMEKPDVDYIAGLSPAISIEQKATIHNPRSTVGTITEIYDYLRLLFARVGQPRCPTHNIPLDAQTVSQMIDSVMALPLNTAIMVLAPVVENRKGEHVQLLEDIKSEGFVRVRIDGEVYQLDNVPALSRHKKHTIEIVIDRLKIREDIRLRLAESFEAALNLSKGILRIASMETVPTFTPLSFSSQFACHQCGYNITELEPRLFSFNNPSGACQVCSGLGVEQKVDEKRVVRYPQLSLAVGAIPGWDQYNSHYFSILESLAKHYKFSLKSPFDELPAEIQQIILYGSKKEKINLNIKVGNGRSIKRSQNFEGIMNYIERRYLQTESSSLRENMSSYLSMQPCQACKGTRLREEARHVYLADITLPELTTLSIKDALKFLENLTLTGYRGEVANKILKEIIERLQFLVNVGLEYLTLHRQSESLSGGEAQRIRLASQIGAGLVGVMYILDEPSIGLHQRDNERLLKTLVHLRDLGNTVIVVEHDEEAIRAADYIVDVGPGAGIHGGNIVAAGPLATILAAPNSLTGQYLTKKLTIAIPQQRVPVNQKRLIKLKGASANNLKSVNLEIPLGLFTCITGVSGSGKSSLINDTLYPLAAKALNGAYSLNIAPYETIRGLEHLDKVIDIDQSPIGRTPRSNPATYTGMFTMIRELFASTKEARSRGYKPGRFSFNVKGGRCEACRGDGLIRVEMHFLADIHVTCDVCNGKRYNHQTLDIFYKGKSIHEVLQMTAEEGYHFFESVPSIARKCQTLLDVGLGYVALGQSATTLSGGEAQRVKLAKELSKCSTGKTLYILDEPTTGLHFHDVQQLLQVLHRLRDEGNTIVVIEHNLDVIKTADWLVDLGPEGGEGGGTIIISGTPETVAQDPNSHTGRFLKEML